MVTKQPQEMNKEDNRREVLLGEYYFLVRQYKEKEALEFAKRNFPDHLYQRIKIYGPGKISRKDFDIPNDPSEFSQFRPVVKNLAGKDKEKYVFDMKKRIAEYNLLVYQGRFLDAIKIAKQNFSQDEIEKIEKEGHSLIYEYQLNKEEPENKPESNNSYVYKKVTKVFVNETKLLYNLMYENGTLVQTTWNHPFYIVGKGWVEAKDLKVGDFSKTVTGKLKLTKIEIQNLENPVKVYNFEVEGTHTYFVSNSEILVHNYGGEEFVDDLKNKGLKGAAKNLKEAIKNKVSTDEFKTDEEILVEKQKKIEAEKEEQYNEISKKVLSERGIDAVNGGIKYMEENPKMEWFEPANGTNNLIDCGSFVGRAFQTGGFGYDGFNSKDKYEIGPIGFSGSPLYRKINKNEVQAGDVKVGMLGIERHVIMFTGRDGEQAILESSPGKKDGPKFNRNYFTDDYYSKKHGGIQTNDYYRRKISDDYFEKKANEYYKTNPAKKSYDIKEYWNKFKEKNPDDYFDKNEWNFQKKDIYGHPTKK